MAIPTTLTAPAITGDPVVGETLETDTGTWTGEPESFTYSWKRNGVVIPLETGDSLDLTTADLDALITVVVVASNEDGPSLPRTSAAVGPVEGAPTSTNDASFVVPKRFVNGVLHVNPGEWDTNSDGETELVVIFERSANGNTWTTISEDSFTSDDGSVPEVPADCCYRILRSDKGKFIRATLTLNGEFGSSEKTIAAVGPVVFAGDIE